jgi:ATP-dependent Clp protease, protease subunit
VLAVSGVDAQLLVMPFHLGSTVFAAKTEGEDLVLDVFDIIGRDWFGEGITAKSVARTLSQNASAKRIVVRVNSPGGSTTEGTAIYNLLRMEGKSKKIRVEILGLAASMASIIALAGDEVVMGEGSLYMIHNPWTLAIGDANDIKKSVALLDKIKSAMLDIYTARSSASRDDISKMMDEETWMTATEALRHGFIDGTIVNDDADAKVDEDRAFAVLSRFNKTPAQLLNRFKSASGQELVAAMTRGDFTPKKDKKNMNPRILALLGLAATATDDDVINALESRGNASSVNLDDYVPRADFERISALLATAQGQAKKSAEEVFEAKVDASLDKHVESGRIAPAAKAYHRAMVFASDDPAAREKAFKSFEAFAASLPELVGNRQTAKKVEDEAKASSTDTEDMDQEMADIMGIDVADFAEGKAAIKKDKKTYHPTAYRFVDA